MDEAKLICEFLEERIPGIVAAVGYGSEFDKTAEELDSLKTERKMDRTMRAHSIIALPSMVEEFSWKKNENQYDYLIFCEDVKSSFVAAMTTIKECNTPTTKMFVIFFSCIIFIASEANKSFAISFTDVFTLAFAFCHSCEPSLFSFTLEFSPGPMYFDTISSWVTGT